MAQSARARRVGITATALLIGALAGCGSSPPIDMYYGTNVGADFRAPVTDGSANDTNVTPGSDAGGSSGGAGLGGQAGGLGGSGGISGAAGQSGTDAAAGNPGAAGAGA